MPNAVISTGDVPGDYFVPPPAIPSGLNNGVPELKAEGRPGPYPF
jgi:hypothetical protein